ncbi:substrate-binding periplasmic protein [Halopseudomonas pelagia]|uniref:substrate-binding periplasmic protein n=2 Tax=Halopseudomonas pelagia TaxID=553151 RepID=UPI001376F078|nr:ABC transporter substrate-binding protein [Halopseudomonas pelagia]
MPLRIACLLLLACCSSEAFSQSSDMSPDTEPGRIAFMTADVWPWGYLDAEGQPAGLLSEFAERLAHVAELPLDNRVLPHQRLLAEFKRGQGDYTVVFKNPDLDNLADSLGEVLSADILLVANPEFVGNLTLAALDGKRVGYISGTYYGEAFQQNDKLIKISVYSLDQAIEMLRINRLDAVISSDIVFHHSLISQGLQPNAFRYEIHTRGQTAHLYVSRQATNKHIAPRLQLALEKMHQAGKLRTLFYSELRSSADPLQSDH